MCSDERGWAENPLVYCDGQGCNVAVHQACYGIVQVPTGPWFCRKCESQERSARVRCELCPSKDGALKRTDNGGWAHVVCALYIPEIRFGNVTTMEPIILQLVPQDRFNKNCYLCEEHGTDSKAVVGACMQCNKSGCKQYFHVTCAQAAGLLCEEAGHYTDNVKYCGYCGYHYQKLISMKLNKKDGNIKAIPAFKPIPADNATPEPSPEKITMGKPEIKEKSRGNRVEKKAAKLSQLASHSTSLGGSTSTAGAGTMSSSMLANTMNSGARTINIPEDTATLGESNSSSHMDAVAETVITQSGSPVFAAEKQKKKKSGTGVSLDSNSRIVNSGKGSVLGSQSPISSSMSSPSSSSSLLSAATTATSVSVAPPAPISDSTVAAIGGAATPMPSFCAMYETIVNGGTKENYELVTDNIIPVKRPKALPNDKVERKKHRKTSGIRSKLKMEKDDGEMEQMPKLQIGLKKKRHKVKLVATAPPNNMLNSSIIGSVMADTDHTYYRSVATAAAVTAAALNQPTVNMQNGLLPPGLLHQPQTQNEMNGLVNENFSRNIQSKDGNMGSMMMNCSPSNLVPLPKTSNFSPNRSASGKTTENTVPPPFPTTLEQLLERQWEQGSQFLMDQSQHFDIAALLSCLHQLQTENQRLEEHVNNLAARRDHLLAVNARLALPLTNSNSYHNHHSHNLSSSGTSPDGSRTPRLINFMPLENGVSHSPHVDSNYNKSPLPGMSPGLNGLPMTPSPIPSHLAGASPSHQNIMTPRQGLHQQAPQAFLPNINPSSVMIGPQQSYLGATVTSTLDLVGGSPPLLSNASIQPIVYTSLSTAETIASQRLQATVTGYQTISPPYSTPSPTSSINPLCTNMGMPMAPTPPSAPPSHNSPAERVSEER